jgi:hypothetical protein
MPRALKTRVAQLQKLAAAADVHEVELPAVGPFRDELETALEEVVSTKTRQDTLKRLLQEAGRELQEQMASATEMGDPAEVPGPGQLRPQGRAAGGFRNENRRPASQAGAKRKEAKRLPRLPLRTLTRSK